MLRPLFGEFVVHPSAGAARMSRPCQTKPWVLVIAGAAACCLFSSAHAEDAGASPTLATPEAAWAAITQCAALTEDESRHECSDDVMRKAGLLEAPEGKSSDREKRFGLPRPARNEATAVPEAVDVTLAKVDQGGDGKLVLTTTDGAVWRQVEREAIRPMPEQGQTMAIEKASLGGFLCKTSRWVSFRCFRAR